MIANIYFSLILLSSWTLISTSLAALDCSSFKSDKDIIRSLSYSISINPTYPPFPYYNYALVNNQGLVTDLFLSTIKSMPLSIFCLKGLQSLTLQGSTDLSIPTEIIRLASSLTSLNLISISQSLTLPTELFNVTSLKSLSIISSGLEILPEAIGQLFLLSNLTLTGNRLRSLPTSLGKMDSLRWLTVDDNVLLSSLDVLSGYKGLLGLNASNCAIDHLPSNMSSLTMIDMSKNKLTSLGNLDSLTKNYGYSFIFNNNSITTIPATIGLLLSLDNLDLSNNLLTELPGWVYNISLRTIKVRNNKFDPIETEWIRGLFRPTNTNIDI